MRLTTGIGIALGGVGGALAALMGAPRAADVAEPVSPATASEAVEAEAEGSRGRGAEGSASPAISASPSAGVATATPSASVAPPSPAGAPTLNVPATPAELNKAMLYCDQKKDFDECTRVAQAFDLGSAGRVDPEQAKRFRKIALTHLVMQCETGNSPHACYVLAAKYRAGTELAANPAGAEALEKRALELCRFRSAPECPSR